MPISRRRKKAVYTPPPTRSAAKMPSPVWIAPAMLTLFVVGILWLVVFYVTDGDYPISSLENWNLMVGFGFIIAGFGLSTQWR